MRFGHNNHFAQGRLKAGVMNKTEARFAEHLEGERILGRVLWYQFEGIKLRLADNTFLTVDFCALRSDGLLEMIDVKATTTVTGGDGSKKEAAFAMDDSKVKLKIAAEKFPFIFSVVFQSRDKQWIRQEI